MKKIKAAIFIAEILLLVFSVACAGSVDKKEYIRNVMGTFDIEFSTPEEFYAWEEYTENSINLRYGVDIVTGDNGSINIDILICKDDALSDGKSMNELDENELKLLEATYEYQEEIRRMNTADGQLFISVKWTENKKPVISYLTIYDSCMIELLAEKSTESESVEFTEEELEIMDAFIRSIRFTDSYMSLEGSWRINDKIAAMNTEGSAELKISRMNKEQGTEFVFINILASNPETGDHVYLVKDENTGELVILRTAKEAESGYEFVADITPD